MDKKIPEETIIRLSYYLRALSYFQEDKKEVVSSRQLADVLKISHHQLRKDLSYFGHFGKKGVGYSCSKLIESLKDILGLDKEWFACVVGFGNLGKALSFYRGFRDQGICIKAAFDIDRSMFGKTYSSVKVYPLSKMEEVVKKERISIGIITAAKEAARDIANRLCRCGTKAILNFAPIQLDVPSGVIVKDVDLSCQLSALTYCLKTQQSGQL